MTPETDPLDPTPRLSRRAKIVGVLACLTAAVVLAVLGFTGAPGFPQRLAPLAGQTTASTDQLPTFPYHDGREPTGIPKP